MAAFMVSMTSRKILSEFCAILSASRVKVDNK